MLHELHCPDIKDVTTALKDHLSVCFAQVTAEVVDCPNLRGYPYHLTLPGLCGSETLCDIGSFDYFLPVADKTKRYDLLDAFNTAAIKHGIIIGAGAGPHFLSGVNSELTANLSTKDGKVETDGSYYGHYDAHNNAPVSTPSNSTEFSMVAQLFMCEGKSGKVIKLTAKQRTREGKFDALLREALAAKYASLDRPVGLGGVVVQETGKCMFHVLPEFCSEPLDTPTKLKSWLKFFEMSAPVTAVGVALSHDPQNWKLRLEHFHCFNPDRSKSGHCHFDVDGDLASYTAYLIPGKKLLRIDPPPVKH